MKSFVRSYPLLFAILVTAGFLLLIEAGNRLGGSRDDAIGMAIEGLTRVAVVLAACATAAAAGWAEHGFSTARGAGTWAMFAAPFVYLATVYPLLFTGSLGPNLAHPAATALVGAGSFAAGYCEELVYRGLVFFALFNAWSRSRGGLWRAAVVSSVLFSVPHILNLLAGHQLLRVLAQIAWAFLLGIAFAILVRIVGSVWPAAVLHGALDAIVATNRMGKKIVLSPGKAAVMVLVAFPVLFYALALLRRRLPRA